MHFKKVIIENLKLPISQYQLNHRYELCVML